MSAPSCVWPGCDNPARRGRSTRLCAMHEARRYRGQDMDGPPRRRPAGTPKPPCSVESCGNTAHSKGLCYGHYQRQRTGRSMTEPLKQKLRAPLADRLWSRVERSDGCWIWIGMLDRHGYGAISRGGRGSKTERTHRVAYELLVGPIPDGLVLDHLCRVRNCVRPDHLEPVTLAENKRRGSSVAAVNARKTHCKHGHEFTSENTYTPRTGGRGCRECKRQRDRARYWQRRAA